ncbi:MULTISPECIES: YbaK/EbsC family protein [unclassified Lysinibacillus]|uniref:YbaK/EbsC family protein n=1 Tax=unclassified Lysinibacillus TaxID=2636778 RepID=UPI00380858CD
MAIEKVREHLAQWNVQHKIQELNESSATVELAAQALGCEPERIAKSLSFLVNDGAILIVAAGDAKVDNAKFKAAFGTKAKMLGKDEVLEKIGHDVGGVCPFGVNEGVAIYLDESLKRFTTVFPACGSSSSAIELTISELEIYTPYQEWINVCKGWNE